MSGARQGRRRRILQEEVLSASRELAAYSQQDDSEKTPESERRRYSLPGDSLSAALAKKHFPSHILAPLVAIAGSMVAVLTLGAMHHYRVAASSLLGEASLTLLDATHAQSLASWLATSSMLSVAMMGALILAVRCRRVDDYKGRHRLWKSAIALALLLSIDAATNLHHVVAQTLTSIFGVGLFAGGAGWWLLGGSLVVGWIGVRVLRDIKESKLALLAYLAASACGLMSVAASVWSIGGSLAPLVAILGQVAAYTLVAGSLVAYMRFLRRDVAAGVANKPQKSRAADLRIAKATAQQMSKPAKTTSQEPEPGPQTARKPKRQKPETTETTAQWTDGSDGYSDSYDDDARPRKLSKSQRKRLRKQKTDRHAA